MVHFQMANVYCTFICIRKKNTQRQKRTTTNKLIIDKHSFVLKIKPPIYDKKKLVKWCN